MTNIKLTITRDPLGALILESVFDVDAGTHLTVETTPEGLLKLFWPDGKVSLIPIVAGPEERLRISMTPILTKEEET